MLDNKGKIARLAARRTELLDELLSIDQELARLEAQDRDAARAARLAGGGKQPRGEHYKLGNGWPYNSTHEAQLKARRTRADAK